MGNSISQSLDWTLTSHPNYLDASSHSNMSWWKIGKTFLPLQFLKLFSLRTLTKNPMKYFCCPMGMLISQSLERTLTSLPTHLDTSSHSNTPCWKIGKKILPSLFLRLFPWLPLTQKVQLNTFVALRKCWFLSPWTEPWPPTPFTLTLAVTATCQVVK